MTQSALGQAPTIPDTPAGHTLSAFLDAFNSADRNKLDAYVKTYEPSDTVDDLSGFSSQVGKFTLLAILDSKPGFITFRVKQSADNRERFGTFILASTTPPKVKDWNVRLIPLGASIDNTPLDSAARQRTINAIAAKLTEFYVYPEVAQKMIRALHDHQQRGDYNSLTAGTEFAAALRADLLAVSHDHHIVVVYSPFTSPPNRPPDDGKPHPPSPEDIARQTAQLQHSNCEFSKVEILPRNIGYLKFNAFLDPQICGPTVTNALGFLAHADAVIVDLRQNGGGDPAMVELIASYFFSEPTHINDLYDRHEDKTTQYWTLPYVPGPRISAPLYILTSSRTFSGAEEFSYDMQTQKRATIVGETTGGGAHPVNGFPASDHLIVGVPFARPINPVTHKDWEGTGITPDVKVPASEALEAAQKLAVEKLSK
jgi:hypothetical protein